MSVKVTFLGTGTSQGVPLIGCQCDVCLSKDPMDNRLRSSIHIQTETESIVVDTGPDFRQQMLRSGITNLDAVLFTHGHKDHTAGFDDIRAFNFIQQRDMEVYADERVDHILRKDFDYVFAEVTYPGVPRANIHIINDDPFFIGNTFITPVKTLHYKLPVYGFRIEDFTYITDANFISEEEIEKIKGSRVVVLNALRREKHISHFNLEEALVMADKIGAETTYFTHISHQLGRHEEVSSELPGGIRLAHDQLVISV
ncbi:MAG: MBL fold metallo-hydrolase [Bacteroidetes bacterium]|nr:MBL fold metallo-hydrolase [Bacteroidota bacterium]